MGGRGDDRWTSDKTFQYGRAGNQYNTINVMVWQRQRGALATRGYAQGRATQPYMRADRLDTRQKQYKRHSAEVRGEARTDRM